MKCPEGWRPSCICSVQALEPDEHCDIHGYPNHRICPYCGQMRGHYTACKRCGCTYGLMTKAPEVIFFAEPCQPCGQKHEDIPAGHRRFLSCGCSLADAGCYMITWHGDGLGLICENKEDGERKAFMMNEAWNLSSGFTPDELVKARLEKRS